MHTYIESSMCLQWAGKAFKIDRISRLELEDWNGRYELLLYTILKIVRSDTSEYAISFLRKKKFFPSIQEIWMVFWLFERGSFETAFD